MGSRDIRTEAEKRFDARAGQRLKLARPAAGWTQEALAEKMEVSRQTVIRWECGDRGMSAYVMMRLCRLFGVPFSTLAIGESQKKDCSATPTSAMVAGVPTKHDRTEATRSGSSCR